jgi:glutamate-1-semialdehyde 2,1-aminomutase
VPLSNPVAALSTDDLTERAQNVLPGGNTHAARAYSPAVYVERAQGSRKWLIDGRELVDYTMGHGALLLGHAHPAVVQAVQEQVARGTHYGASHPLEVEWAETIRSLVPSAEQLRFTASGTEGTMLALRLARAATGRPFVVKLREHFHGWADVVSVDVDDAGAPVASPGVPRELSQATRVVSVDADPIRAALRNGDVAALILEPSGAHYGGQPLPEGLVQKIRTACTETGTLLILDEVVTGFRVHPGGMQAVLRVTPDISIFGKVMAGGLPAGAVGGKRELMQLLAGRIMHPGTFNANPLSAAAGITTLRLVADGTPQRTASGYATRLEQAWRSVLRRTGVEGRVWRLASIIHVELDDPSQQAAFSRLLREEGIDLLRTSAFCSAVHSERDLDISVAAFERAAARVRRAG